MRFCLATIFGILIAAINTIANICVAPFVNAIGKKNGLHPYRRANILATTICSFPFFLPYGGCVLLFLGIWGVTVTLPTARLAKNFPEDVQEKLRPRLEGLSMSPKRALGWIILVLFVAGYLGLFVIGGIDGLRRDFTFWQFFLRFFIIGAVIKAFDILALDWFLLTKTHFFQHYFPETEGCAGWQDFGYNRRQQARQCVMIVLGSAVTAWIFALF